MLRTMFPWWLALGALVVAGCSAELAEIVIVVDTDYEIGTQLDEVTIQPLGFADERVVAVPLADQPLPIRFGLVHDGGALGPVTIVVTGRLAGSEVVVAKRTEVFFVRGRTMMLRLDLLQTCDGRCLTGDLTCRAGVCGASAIEEGELVRYRVPTRIDASDASDAGGDAGSSDAGLDARVAFDSGFDAGSLMDAASDASAPDAAPDPNEACSVMVCDAGAPTPATGFTFAPSNFDPAAVENNPSSLPIVTIDCGVVVYDTEAKAAAVTWCGRQLSLRVVEVDNINAPKPLALAFQYLRIAPGSTLRLIGEAPAILVVFGDAWIDGTIDVSAVGATAGAGGNVLCGASEVGANGAAPTVAGTGANGGGGGGFGTSGGGGGLGTATGTVTRAGSASVDVDLVPLRGGCPGGRGGNGFSNAVVALAGAGGGAVQLSVAGDLYLRGVIAAAGGGGRKALPQNTGSGADGGNGGGGGGSGGAILIEAGVLHVAADAWLTANGGGGGGGLAHSVAVDMARDGSDGNRESTTPAAGGSAGSSTPALVGAGGIGGTGAASVVAAAVGANGASGLAGRGGGGGGGGGVGRIVIKRAASCGTRASFSPAPFVALASGTCP